MSSTDAATKRQIAKGMAEAIWEAAWKNYARNDPRKGKQPATPSAAARAADDLMDLFPLRGDGRFINWLEDAARASKMLGRSGDKWMKEHAYLFGYDLANLALGRASTRTSSDFNYGIRVFQDGTGVPEFRAAFDGRDLTWSGTAWNARSPTRNPDDPFETPRPRQSHQPVNVAASSGSGKAQPVSVIASSGSGRKKNPSAEHTKDEDCTVVDGECTVCGVWHSEPCEECGGTGFHREPCGIMRTDLCADCGQPLSDHGASTEPCPTGLGEPAEGDYTTTDYQRFYQDGKLVLSVRPDDDHEVALLEHMDAAHFWPNAWFISDHGNAHLIDFTGSTNPLEEEPLRATKANPGEGSPGEHVTALITEGNREPRFSWELVDRDWQTLPPTRRRRMAATEGMAATKDLAIRDAKSAAVTYRWVYEDRATPADLDWRTKIYAMMAREYRHVPLRQGRSFECSRCGRSGSIHGIVASGPIFTEACDVHGNPRSRSSHDSSVRSPTSTSTEVRSPTSTSTEVRSPTSTSTEVRSPTSTSTEAYTAGNVTVTGGAGAGANTTVKIYRDADGRPRANPRLTDAQHLRAATKKLAALAAKKKKDPDVGCDDPKCPGWIVSDSGTRGLEVERCDDCWSTFPEGQKLYDEEAQAVPAAKRALAEVVRHGVKGNPVTYAGPVRSTELYELYKGQYRPADARVATPGSPPLYRKTADGFKRVNPVGGPRAHHRTAAQLGIFPRKATIDGKPATLLGKTADGYYKARLDGEQRIDEWAPALVVEIA